MSLKFDIVSRLIDTPCPHHRQRLVDRPERPLDQRLKVYPLRRDGRINRVMHVYESFEDVKNPRSNIVLCSTTETIPQRVCARNAQRQCLNLRG